MSKRNRSQRNRSHTQAHDQNNTTNDHTKETRVIPGQLYLYIYISLSSQPEPESHITTCEAGGAPVSHEGLLRSADGSRVLPRIWGCGALLSAHLVRRIPRLAPSANQRQDVASKEHLHNAEPAKVEVCVWAAGDSVRSARDAT